MLGTRSGEFILRISNPMYYSVEKRIKFKIGRLENGYKLGYIRMRRKPKVRQLEEVAVTATKVKFYTRGDTVIYNADAFNLAEGSMLDALVEQLPGVELKRDGRIFVNGEQIESLLLNGKDFFKGDNRVMLDNLPAYTVQNIKVYEKEDDFHEAISKEVGRKVSKGQRVMDVNLKRQYQIGWLGNIEAGAGTEERWLGRLFAMRFTPQSRLTFYANANNTHESRKPGSSGEWSPSEIGSGISTTENGGFDYMVYDKQRRWRVEGNASASHYDTDRNMLENVEHFQNTGSTFTRSRLLARYKTTAFNTFHYLHLNLGPERNRNTLQLRIRPYFTFRHDNDCDKSYAAEFSENPLETDDWESLFQGTSTGKKLTGILINKVQNQTKGNSTNVNGGITTGVDYKIPGYPTSLHFNGRLNGGHITKNNYEQYSLDYKTQSDWRNRYDNLPLDHLDANINFNMELPFDVNWDWVANASADYFYTHDKKENSLYRLDWLEEMNNAEIGVLPSTQAALLEALDRPNSYLTDDVEHKFVLQFNGRYDKTTYRDNKKYTRLYFGWKAGLTVQHENWKYNGQTQRNDWRTALLPSFELETERNTAGMRHALKLKLNYQQRLPSMFSLMGLRFDSDPLNIRVGNTDLRNTDVFSATFYYNPGTWNVKHGQRVWANIGINVYRNAVATAQIYDINTGVRTFRPENVNGNWDTKMAVTFSSRLGKNGFSVYAQMANYLNHNVDLTGTGMQVPQRSVVYTNYLVLPVKFEYSRKKVRLGTKTQIAWNHAESRRENFQTINAADFSVGVNGNITMPWNLQLATDLTYFKRFGYTYEVMNRGDFVWNAQLSKSIMKGNLTFALVGYDILGQLSNITYTVNAQGTTETWRNVIPRNVILRVIYKFNKQPKKNG
ncbi:MAG: outer membrane beta-barrel family protein [Bacteroidaceae bacterium]|nr:outer membrane beta-barrel family protein [Bacteroidaceae bacterium]